MEGCLVIGQGSTRPGVTAEVQGILVALSLIFVLKAVVAELAGILLLHFMNTRGWRRLTSVCNLGG